MSRLVYAEPGSSLQQIGGECPAGWVVMQAERPGVHYCALSDGTWSADPSSAMASAAAQEYLGSTDWYIYRQFETGKPTPPDVLEKRAAARLLVIK